MPIGLAGFPTMWTKPRFWYHISEKNLGYKAYFEPREIECLGEPSRPRICVSPTVAHCLSAICAHDKVYVYRTYRKMSARYPYGICDSYITKERWLFGETCFLRQLTIKYDDLGLHEFSCARGDPFELGRQEDEYTDICISLMQSGLIEEYPHIDFVAPKMLRELRAMV